MKYTKSLLLLVFLGMVGFSASAKKGDAQEYCDYLNGLIASSEKAVSAEQSRTDDLMKVVGFIFEPLSKEAIEKKMTFEQLQADAKKKDIEIGEVFRPIYLREYRERVCGTESKTEAGLDLRDGSKSTILGDTAVKPTLEKRLKDEPYFEDMLKARKKKGRR